MSKPNSCWQCALKLGTKGSVSPFKLGQTGVPGLGEHQERPPSHDLCALSKGHRKDGQDAYHKNAECQ